MALNVLFVSAEAVPFAKVGGMADVVGSLPVALRELGVDARVIMPGYGFINHDKFDMSHLFTFWHPMHEGTAEIKVYSTMYKGVPFYFLQGWPYFGQDGTVYTEWNWDVPRFIFFNQVAMAVAWELRQRMNWFPDVFHVNDWHTGILPFLVAESKNNPIWSETATVLSIHNLQYQGVHVGGYLWQKGIPARHQPDLVYQDKTDNMLAIAIAYSDMVTTVSPRYAVEIQYPYMGNGLENLLSRRLDDVQGILNGIDTNLWNPATDTNLVTNFDVSNFREKRIENKRHLQHESGLPVRDDVPVVGVISRLVWQKGLDLALPALHQLLMEQDVQVILLGTGDPDLEYQCWKLGHDFPGKARMYLQYNAAIAQHIYGGCDLFLMPSHFEPCGMGQMLAMRYGALPLVRETGGLADTVDNYDNGDAETGTGFVFAWETADAVLGTMRWALDTYRNRPDAWQRMQERAMQRDFSWNASARQYIDVYQKALDKKG